MTCSASSSHTAFRFEGKKSTGHSPSEVHGCNPRVWPEGNPRISTYHLLDLLLRPQLPSTKTNELEYSPRNDDNRDTQDPPFTRSLLLALQYLLHKQKQNTKIENDWGRAIIPGYCDHTSSSCSWLLVDATERSTYQHRGNMGKRFHRKQKQACLRVPWGNSSNAFTHKNDTSFPATRLWQFY